MAKPVSSIDSGWAWMIVVAHFLNAFLMLGNARSLGMFFNPLMELIDSNAAAVSTLLTARMLTAMLTALVAPVLSERFTERKVVMAGGVIASCSCIVVYFADNIYYLLVYGVLSGLAMSVVMIPTVAMVGKSFKKRRALAASLGSLGGSIGQLVLPPLYAWLIQEVTIRGAFLIMGGMCLNIVVAGALQRPIDLSGIIRQTPIERVETGSPGVSKDKKETIMHSVNSGDNTRVIKDDDAEIDDETDNDNDNNEQLKTITESSALTNEMCKQRADSQTDPQASEAKQKTRGSFCASLLKVISTKFDVKLFAKPSFLVFIILVGGSFGFYRPVKLFLVPSAKEDGIEDQRTSLLLTVGAVADISTRVVLGYVTDLRIIKPYQVLATAGIIAGIFSCSFPLADQYWSMMLVSALIGFTSDVKIYLPVPIIADLVGVSHMASSLGWLRFASMLSQSGFIPLFGYIRDASGSYDLTFYVCGAFIIVMSAGLFTIVYLEKRSRATTKTTTAPV